MKRIKHALILLVACSLLVVSGSIAAREPQLWNMTELAHPPKTTWLDKSGPLRRLYFEGEPRNGQPTQVFAYCAFPEDTTVKSPGIVLIHGGGGTAFSEWAQLWAQRGYVAIAMDLAGKGPDGQPLTDGGPDQSDDVKFPKDHTPPKECWTYHAVAAGIRAGSLLASLPEVDDQRIAVTGISWGGYLTCIVAGVDQRFRAAVPVYGCGFLADNSCWLQRFADMTPEWKQQWIKYFDPSRYVGRAPMPLLFVNGTNDFAYPLDSYQKTYRLVKDRMLCVTVEMPHGHAQGWAPKEIGLFVDHILRDAPPLPQIDAQAQFDDDYRTASLTWNGVDSVTAQFHWTSDTDDWKTRKWHSSPADIDGNRIQIELPAERPLCGFFTVTDQRGATVSCEHFEILADQKIIDVLQRQVDVWNLGDLTAFMDTYWNSEDLTFSAGGETERGWQATLQRYRKRYPDKQAMGHLTFSNLEVTRLGDAAALVIGVWQLQRDQDSPRGNFSVVLRQIDNRWLIIHDHSSTLPMASDEQ